MPLVFAHWRFFYHMFSYLYYTRSFEFFNKMSRFFRQCQIRKTDYVRSFVEHLPSRRNGRGNSQHVQWRQTGHFDEDPAEAVRYESHNHVGTREQFKDWCHLHNDGNYDLQFDGIGDQHDSFGYPTQLCLWIRNEGNQRDIILPTAGLGLCIGPSNSGKSTWLQTLVNEGEIKRSEVVSSDDFRELVSDEVFIDWTNQ